MFEDMVQSTMGRACRGNGVRRLTVVVEKKGPIQLPDGTDSFGVVESRVEKEVEEMLQPRKPITGPPAVVAISRGLTVSLPTKFEFARIDEYIAMPVLADPAEVEAARLDLVREVEGHVEAECKKIKGK